MDALDNQRHHGRSHGLLDNVPAWGIQRSL